MRELIVDNCRACGPITQVIDALEEQGYKIKNQRLRDYHFNELHFLMAKPGATGMPLIKVDNIREVDNMFICNCHWSMVEIESV